MYDLPTEEITSAIKHFKGINTVQATAQRSTNFTDLQADSSIFILEAALNYDFDKIPASLEMSYDTCNFEINYTNGIVTSTDLYNAYNYFTQFINQQTSGTNKVKVIDITATTTGSKINYKANITLFPDLAQRVERTCSPYASNYFADWSTARMVNYGACAAYLTYNDGPTSCEAKLNCNLPIGGCSGFYWANVTTTHLFTVPNTSPLYYVGFQSNYCQSPINGTTLNSDISTCQSYGASNLPGSSYHIVGYNVIDNLQPDQNYQFFIVIWWSLDITYGTYGCGGTPQ